MTGWSRKEKKREVSPRDRRDGRGREGLRESVCVCLRKSVSGRKRVYVCVRAREMLESLKEREGGREGGVDVCNRLHAHDEYCIYPAAQRSCRVYALPARACLPRRPSSSVSCSKFMKSPALDRGRAGGYFSLPVLPVLPALPALVKGPAASS